jgi:hypothetical protein
MTSKRHVQKPNIVFVLTVSKLTEIFLLTCCMLKLLTVVGVTFLIG